MLAIAAIAAAWPIATAAWIPFTDYPQHAASVAAIHFADDPRFAPYFEVDLRGAKYVLFHLASLVLVPVLGVEGAARAVVAGSLGLLPLAVAAFLAAHRRPPLLGALAGLVALHLYVFWGFVGHVVGFPVAILALAAHEHAIRGPGAARVLGFAAAALVAVLAHPVTFVWMGLGVAMQTLRRREGLVRRLAATAIATLPALVLLLVFAGSFSAGGGDVRRSMPGLGALFSGSRIPDPWEALRAAPRHAFGYYDDGAGTWVGLFFAAVLAALLVARALGRGRADGALPEALAGVTLLLYFVVPIDVLSVHFVGVRFLPMALALAAAIGPPRLDGTIARLALGSLLVATSATAATIHVGELRRAAGELAGLERVLDAAEPGRRLLGLVLDARSAVVATPAHLHVAQYYVVLRGGFAAVSFTSYPTSPVKLRAGVEPPTYPRHFEFFPAERYDHAELGGWFDYFLVRETSGKDTAEALWEGADPPRPVARAGRWILFEHTRGDDTEGPRSGFPERTEPSRASPSG